MSNKITKTSLTLGVGALVACFAAAGVAQAATIYACVKPSSGATRIVKAKTKCRRGEQKLSWNTAGPRGPAGANGANGPAGVEGKPGANGAVTVYTTSRFYLEPLSLPLGGTVVLTKVLPPGSFAVTAKTLVRAEESKAATVEMVCDLADVPGTTGAGEGTVLDVTAWEGPLGEQGAPSEFGGETSLSLASTLTSGVTSTLELSCVNLSGQQMKSVSPQMQAITVASVL